MKDKMVTVNSTHWFTKDKSILSNLTDSYDETISSVDKGTAADVVYFDFHKTFGQGLP